MSAAVRVVPVSPSPPSLTGPAGRLVGLDALRGLAVLLMVADHVSRYVPGGWWFSVTGGRVAVPLFFVVAGALVSRLSWRHGGVAVLGLALPLVVPWIDAPNVLVLYVVGVVAVLACRAVPVLGVLVVVAALTAFANQWPGPVPVRGAYVPLALLGLMVVGQLAGRVPVAAVAGRLPGWLAWVGRFPLSV